MRGLRRQALGAAALVALALVAGCGPESGEEPAAGSDASEQVELLGPRPGKLTCTDWNEGTHEARLGTIGQLTASAGANANPEDVGPSRTLSDEDAYDALEGTCEHELARGFLLYEVYNRGAAFNFDLD